MWKCSNCGTDNEYNFCVNCQNRKEESGLKTPTSEQGQWKCSRCGAEIDGNFCGQCQMSRAENDTWQPPPEQATHQPPHQQAIQHQPEDAKRSSKKGVIIAIVALVAIVALLVTVVVFAMRLILNNGGDGARDSEPDTYVEEVEMDEIEEAQVVMIDSDGPYNLNVWGESNVIQLENNSIVLDVPLPPGITTEEVELTGSTLTLEHGEGSQWFHVLIDLGNEQLEDDFREYAEDRIDYILRILDEWGGVHGYRVYEERNATLFILYWEDEFSEVINFVKKSEVEGFLLVTDILFESLENREDFFEAYGFNDHFESIIQEVVDEWEANRADSSNQDEDEDRDNEVLWTDEQMYSNLEYLREFSEVRDLSFGLYFDIWDMVFLDNTIYEYYPNADTDRLIELHTEFTDRFDELNVHPGEMDFTLPYDSEYNQNIFQAFRELIQEFERINSDFRAALEGR